MKAGYLKIENYKGITSFEVNELSNINVIAGINGSGKTTILTAVKILLSWFIARIHNPKGRGLTLSDSDISNGKDYCFLKIRLDNGVEWQIYKQHSKVRKAPVYKTDTGVLNEDRRLETVRSTICSQLDGYTDFKVQRSPKAFVISKHNMKFDFKDLSDGEKAYLTLVSDIARKMAMCHPMLNNPLDGDGIVLIDEIDLHLHPTWQREVIGKLRNTFVNCQFILTTHSPHIVSSISPNDGDKLIVVKKGNANEVTDNLFGQESDMVLSDVFL